MTPWEKKKITEISYLPQESLTPRNTPNASRYEEKHKQREGVSADMPTRQPLLECLSCCYEKAHLLLGNPGYGIIKEPSPLLGTHAVSLASE